MPETQTPLDRINAEQMDIFREIGTIGTGNATTSLASMLNVRMEMTVPNVSIMPFKNITDVLNGPENIVVGIMVNISGDLNGFIMLVLDVKDASEMISLLLGEPPEHYKDLHFSEMDYSALTEISNILVGSYINAISTLTQLNIIPTVPEVTVDMAGAIMSVPAIAYGKIGDGVLMLETEFSNKDKAIAGHFFLIPDLDSYYVLMKSLGVDI